MHGGSHHTGANSACHSEPACLLQHATAVAGGLEHFPEAGAAANIGILMFRTAGHNLAEVKRGTHSAVSFYGLLWTSSQCTSCCLTMLGSLPAAHPETVRIVQPFVLCAGTSSRNCHYWCGLGTWCHCLSTCYSLKCSHHSCAELQWGPGLSAHCMRCYCTGCSRVLHTCV